MNNEQYVYSTVFPNAMNCKIDGGLEREAPSRTVKEQWIYIYISFLLWVTWETLFATGFNYYTARRTTTPPTYM